MDAYIGLGSNIEPRVRHLTRAVHLLGSQDAIRLEATSPVFRSEAHTMGGGSQPDFLNAVVRVRTALSPARLLETCLSMEHQLGRERNSQGWAPRTIDLDLLLYEDEVISTERLVIPHPRMHERLFVLRPLLELWPSGRNLPGFRRTPAELIAACPDVHPPVKTIITLENHE